MKFRGDSVVFLLFFSIGELFAASTVPAPRNDALPDVVVETDDGRVSHVGDLLRPMGEGPILLLPLFTRCSTTCPTLLHKLEKSVTADRTSSRVRVLVFSFDPAETTASLRAFRTASGIPTDWVLARADEDVTRTLLQYLNYPVMSRGAVFIHPSEIFVLDSSLHWSWTIDGVIWTPEDLANVIERTASPNFVSRLQRHPEVVGWIALGFALGGICLAIGFWARTRTVRAWHLRYPGFCVRSEANRNRERPQQAVLANFARNPNFTQNENH